MLVEQIPRTVEKVLLPCDDWATATQGSGMTGSTHKFELRKALCVLPDQDTFELIRFLLLERGFRTSHAAGASEALQAMRTIDYDVYIIDNWRLTDGDGIQLCREIRRTDAITPILFYSANAFPSEIAKALQAGAQAYIPLPDLSGELVSTIEKLVDAAEREALKEETRCISEHLAERMQEVEGRQEAAAKHLDHAIKSALRAHALADFIKAGGKRARFDRLWGRAFRKALGSADRRP
jgi:DNA-binding response OmpR family regulator